MTYEGLELHEWIARGRENGTIAHVSTVIGAYCLDEPRALTRIARIVKGEMAEPEALTGRRSDPAADSLPDAWDRGVAVQTPNEAHHG